MANMEHADAITRMQEYIENNLKTEITLHNLAEQAGYSPWHCAKMFKDYTGKSPFEYIRGLRLSKAALALRDDNLKVVDVAMDFLFDSHEGFTRAFRRQFGLPPKKYQKDTPPIQLFNPYPVRSYYIMQEDKNDMPSVSDHLHIQIMHYPQRKMILLRGEKGQDYMEYTSEVGCDVWGMLVSIKEALYEPVGIWLPDRFRPKNTSYYAQGVEVPADYNGIIPEGYDILDLPPCTMMMFQSEPYDEDFFAEVITDIASVIDNYDPSQHGFKWADYAPRIQLEPQGYRGYIEGRPVTAVQ